MKNIKSILFPLFLFLFFLQIKNLFSMSPDMPDIIEPRWQKQDWKFLDKKPDQDWWKSGKNTNKLIHRKDFFQRVMGASEENFREKVVKW